MEESKETMFVTYASSLGGATAASASAVFSVSKFLGATEAAAAPLARAAAGAWASGRRTRGPRRRRLGRCPSIDVGRAADGLAEVVVVVDGGGWCRRRGRGRRRRAEGRGVAAQQPTTRARHATSTRSAPRRSPAPGPRARRARPGATAAAASQAAAARSLSAGGGARRRTRATSAQLSRKCFAARCCWRLLRRSSLKKLISTASGVVLSSCSICGGSIICSRCPAAQRLLRSALVAAIEDLPVPAFYTFKPCMHAKLGKGGLLVMLVSYRPLARGISKTRSPGAATRGPRLTGSLPQHHHLPYPQTPHLEPHRVTLRPLGLALHGGGRDAPWGLPWR